MKGFIWRVLEEYMEENGISHDEFEKHLSYNIDGWKREYKYKDDIILRRNIKIEALPSPECRFEGCADFYSDKDLRVKG